MNYLLEKLKPFEDGDNLKGFQTLGKYVKVLLNYKKKTHFENTLLCWKIETNGELLF